MKIENYYKEKLPEEYLEFLKKYCDGSEKYFNEFEEDDAGRYWTLYSEATLIEKFEMFQVGEAMHFESLKLYLKLYKEYAVEDFVSSNMGNIKFNRIESGFTIGTENGDLLYLDPNDNYSVWIYYNDGGDVLRISDSFKEFIESPE